MSIPAIQSPPSVQDIGPQSNTKVYQIQQALNLVGTKPRLAEDGIFGPKTKAAIERFQQAHDLPKTGVVDGPTLNELNEALEATRSSRMTDRDWQQLERYRIQEATKQLNVSTKVAAQRGIDAAGDLYRKLPERPVTLGERAEAVVDGAVNLGKGVLSVPVDLYYGAGRTVRSWGLHGLDEAAEIGIQNEEVAGLLKDIVQNPETLHKVVDVALNDFYTKLNPSDRERIALQLKAKGGGYIGGRVVGSAISSGIAKKVLAQLAAEETVGAVGGAVTAGTVAFVTASGVVQRSVNASDELRKENPVLWKALDNADKKHGKVENMHLLWFLVKPAIDDIKEDLGYTQ